MEGAGWRIESLYRGGKLAKLDLRAVLAHFVLDVKPVPDPLGFAREHAPPLEIPISRNHGRGRGGAVGQWRRILEEPLSADSRDAWFPDVTECVPECLRTRSAE